MKQFIRNILSHVKREQVKEKIKTSLSWRDEDLYINKPALYTGTDFTLNVATMKEQLISTIYPNDRDIKIIASYDEDEQRYQPISQPKLRNTWFRKLNALYLEKDNYRRDLWTRDKGITDNPRKMPYIEVSFYNKGFKSQLIPVQEEVPKEYEHLIPHFNIIEITRIEIIEKELLLESVRPFRFVKDLRVPILTETDRFIKIYYKYNDIKQAQERYDEKQSQLELETTFNNLIEGKE
mgnify:FL=1